MIKITSFAITICLFFTAALQGQTCCTCAPVDDFEGHNWYNVSAPSGLILRADPSRSAKKLDAIPFGEQVLGCRSTSVEETIEGKSGRYFAGDLDGDQQLDLILAHLDGVGSSFTLFLSSKKLPSFLLRCVASFRDTAC